ncbi:hypothetical protein WEIDD23_02128 [Weissella sp. DD23]|nr:hypothetical protein WEIDD23_02128 [Weissella sp. DD23]
MTLAANAMPVGKTCFLLMYPLLNLLNQDIQHTIVSDMKKATRRLNLVTFLLLCKVSDF